MRYILYQIRERLNIFEAKNIAIYNAPHNIRKIVLGVLLIGTG